MILLTTIITIIIIIIIVILIIIIIILTDWFCEFWLAINLEDGKLWANKPGQVKLLSHDW